MMNCSKNVLFQTAAFAAIAAVTFATPASAQEHISAPQVFGGDTAFHATTDISKVIGTAAIASPTSDAGVAAGSDADLPDAPSAVLRGSNVSFEPMASQGNMGPRTAPITMKYIPAGWTAQHLTAHDKVVLGFHDSVTLYSFLGILISAGYSHMLNGQPNYGTDRGAFGERLGATAIRDTSEQLFTDVVFAPLLHEDSRYYVEGNQYSFIHRVLYAGTRPLITRTDSGKSTLNGALLLGYASASGLSYAYYPAINQNFRDTVATFGGSLGGAALGDVVSEFADQVLVKLHLKRPL
jgi:hypothetical protein